MLPRLARLPLLALVLMSGCDSSEGSSGGGSTSSVPPPVLVLTAPADACIEVPPDRDASVAIGVQLKPGAGATKTGFTLKPPGTCGVADPCGYIVVAVKGADGELAPNNSGVGPLIDLFSTPDRPLTGTVEVKGTLVDEQGNGYAGDDGKVVETTLSFAVQASCGGGTGGSGGTGGAGGSGGAGTGGSTGGTGGMGSTATGTGGTGGSTGMGGAGGSTSTGSGT